ncbi:hydrogenase assembly protein HypC [Rhodothalassium salexigens]|uniref:HypC/HybG/HupF family hydrogenase formation chaperone n=1 Tax=Rhodothalassium salexigens TaxID=1086 RepID=UPI0019125EDE|nr:HypC/HybG/HupF family hydrogenase formation chaperone [Rhodothalassium salexigens]MBK5911109.1 hydrogenase assembly protein HypC [Rhodothalassium salexigens]MBK5919473.1 hydrogenase assembly protein HypC [Rhodothalassium salexigens]
MCLAIPMRVTAVDGLDAHCAAGGAARTVSLFLLQHEVVVPGDLVLVHVGYALARVSEDRARAAWALYDEIRALDTAPAPVEGQGDA